MKAVVGLGNPGPEYDQTRHNVGADVVGALAGRNGAKLTGRPSRLRSLSANLRIGPEQVVVAIPLTYVNESGAAVRALVDYFDLSLPDVIVIHDDIDLPFGRLRLQVGGGTGGHNGLRSIQRGLGSADFNRLKVGVGRPPGTMDPADFVLRRFANAERIEVDRMIADAADSVEAWVTDPESGVRLAGERKLS